MPRPKKYIAENDYDTSITCTECGAAVHVNMLVSVSKDKVRCTHCGVIFVPKAEDVR
jgi:transposase